MSIQNFFRSLISYSTPRRAIRRRPAASRLCLGSLEERGLLAFSPPVDYGAGLNPIGLVAADFNGDGRIDLAALDNANSGVKVLLGNGEGTFQLPRTSSTGDRPKALQVETRFHRTMWRASGNPVGEEMLTGLFARLEVARDTAMRGAGHMSLAVDMHERTLAALVSGDRDEIDAAMDEHLSYTERLVAEAFA